MRIFIFLCLLLLTLPAGAQSPDMSGWIRLKDPEIEARLAGRTVTGRYADQGPGFRARFGRDGAFFEQWSRPLEGPHGKISEAEGRWFVRDDLICEDLPTLAEAPFCGAVYEKLDANREAYKFIDPGTGQLISYTTEVAPRP